MTYNILYSSALKLDDIHSAISNAKYGNNSIDDKIYEDLQDDIQALKQRLVDALNETQNS